MVKRKLASDAPQHYMHYQAGAWEREETWINSQTGALESYTKIYTSEAGGEIYLGCDYQHMAGNGDTRITRKITREVRIGN